MVSILGHYWVQKPTAVPFHVFLLQIFICHPPSPLKPDCIFPCITAVSPSLLGESQDDQEQW